MKYGFSLLCLFFLAIPGHALAQYVCPPGYYSIGGGQDAGGFYGCAPMEGEEEGPLPPQWENRWGAIAVTDGAYGVAAEMRSKREAVSVALKECKARAGGRKCHITTSYYNQCVALAWGDQGSTSFRGPEMGKAEQSAMSDCAAHAQNCKIYYSGCSYPERVD